MLIKLTGKAQGTSKKSGNKYMTAHYLCKKPNVEGQSAGNMFVNPNLIDYDKLIIGKDYNADFDENGFLSGIYAV